MRVVYADPLHTEPMKALEKAGRVVRAPFADVLAQADFVTLHPDLNATSRGLIDAGALASMKKTAILINASRGPVVNEAALVEALTSGRIAGAGLDVFEEEPRIHPGLLPLPNVTVAPHIASASLDTRIAMATLAVRNCLAVLEGKPPLTPVS